MDFSSTLDNGNDTMSASFVRIVATDGNSYPIVGTSRSAPALGVSASIGAVAAKAGIGLTEAAGAPFRLNLLIPTIRNNQLPTAELAELLNASPAEIDAIRALGHYSGGDLLESSLIARDLGSEVVL